MSPSRRAAQQPGPVWMDRSLGLHAASNLFAHFLNIPCSLVTDAGLASERWHVLGAPRERLAIGNYEAYFGRSGMRKKYNHACIQKLRLSRGSHLGRFGPFADLFAAIPGTRQAVLVAGSFLPALPTVESMAEHFHTLTGKQAGPAQRDFVELCRISAETPFFDDVAQAGLRQVLQALASYFSGELDGEALLSRFRKLQSGIFGPHLPYRVWNFVASRRHRLFWGHGSSAMLNPWDQEELGISAYPRQAFALMPRDPSRRGRGEAAALLKDAALQRDCFMLAHDFKDCLSGPLEGGGVLFLASLKGAAGSALRMKARDMAEALRAKVSRACGAAVAVGVGGLGYSPEDLPAAIHEAVLALHLCQHENKPLLLYEERRPGLDQAENAAGGLSGALDGLRRAFQGAEPSALRLAAEGYAREILLRSGERAEAMRVHLFYAVAGLLQDLSQRAMLPEHELQRIRQDWEGRLEAAAETYDLMALFREFMAFVGTVLESPVQGERGLRLDMARRYIESHLSEPLSLDLVARKAGFSGTRFSRLFKAQTGTNFSAFLLRQRLERAQALLRNSGLPVHQVAQECGFGTSSYFVQAFGKAFKETPQVYRLGHGKKI